MLKFILSIFLICISFGCATNIITTRLEKNKDVNSYIVLDIDKNCKEISFYSTDKLLINNLKYLSKNKFVFNENKLKADLVISSDFDIKCKRDWSWKMSGNLLSICIGFFYFNFNIDCNANFIVDITNEQNSNIHKYKKNYQKEFNHPGYIKEFPKKGSPINDLFYNDIIMMSREILTNKIASAIIKDFFITNEKD